MSKEIEVVQKEVSEYKNQISFVQDQSKKLVITSEEDMAKGSDLLDELKLVEKAINDRKKAITKPLMDGLASVRNLFKPLETAYSEAKATIKDKMLVFTIAEEERINLEKSRVEARVEKGTMRTDTAVNKLEGIGEVKKSFTGETGKTSIRKVTKVRIVDESLIPREYLIPDEKKITEAVLKGGAVIAGVETYEEKSIVSRTR